MDDMSKNRALERELSEFWDLEAIGIQPQTRQRKFQQVWRQPIWRQIAKEGMSQNPAFQLHTVCNNI